MRSKTNKFCLFLFVIIGVGAHLCFALAQSDSGRMQKAKEYFAAGREFVLQGNYTAADSEFKKAQQLLGVTPVLSVAKAKPEAAIAASRTVKAKEAVIDMEKTKDPFSYYAKAIKLQPKNSDLHYNLAVEYLKVNEYSRAAEEFKRTLQLNHRDKDACYNLGVLYENYLEDRIQAIYYYSHYIDLAPRAEDVWRVRVWIRDLKMQIANEK